MLLGPVHIRVGAHQQPLRGRRQRIAVARLALAEGRPVPVSSLIEDLWIEKRPRNAMHALQAHMHRLRTLLPLDIEHVGDGYRLVDDSVRVDARQFTELSERGRAHLVAGEPRRAAADLDDALRLWRGPALADIDDVPGVRPFALRLSSIRQEASDERVEALLQCGEGHSLINGLRASLALDPLQETAWHQLMRALWRAGQEAEAIAAYGQARAAFIDVLGSEPGSRLAQLHNQMLSGTSAPWPAGDGSDRSASRWIPPPADASVLVGRRAEIAVLQAAWERSRTGVQFVTLSGEAGIGKTRLSEEWGRRIGGPDVVELRGRCDPAIPLAYQPFADMLRAHPGLPSDLEEQSEWDRLAPKLLGIVPGAGDTGIDAVHERPDVDPHLVMDALAAWLAHLSGRRPLLVRIDDVQWADEQTVRTLRHLLHSPHRINALIVLCSRDDRAVLPAGSALAEFLRQSEHVTHLPLSRLSRQETRHLISTESRRLSGQDTAPPWMDDYVQGASGGNPLFVVELTRQLLLQGAPGALRSPRLLPASTR